MVSLLAAGISKAEAGSADPATGPPASKKAKSWRGTKPKEETGLADWQRSPRQRTRWWSNASRTHLEQEASLRRRTCTSDVAESRRRGDSDWKQSGALRTRFTKQK